MRRIAIGLIALVAISVANPTMEYFLSEIQVAPDSLERVEVHMYSRDRPYPIDLSGCQIVTNAGAATIDSGVVLQDSTDFVVISRGNTTGTFSLGDSADTVELVGLSGDIDPYEYGSYGWAPPDGMSAAVYAHWVGIWPDEYVVCQWYLDSTPTFGAPNDDRYGGIAGRVLDRFNRPLRWCMVWFGNASGRAYAGCDTTGRYIMSPLGPGTYQVSARSDSTYLPAYYPDSVTIGVNGWRDSVNITMYPVGIAGDQPPTSQRQFLRWAGWRLLVSSDGTAPVSVELFNQLGSRVRAFHLGPIKGERKIELPATLAPGVYFATAERGSYRTTAKVVLW